MSDQPQRRRSLTEIELEVEAEGREWTILLEKAFHADSPTI
jgi:hypothetical protein